MLLCRRQKIVWPGGGGPGVTSGSISKRSVDEFLCRDRVMFFAEGLASLFIRLVDRVQKYHLWIFILQDQMYRHEDEKTAGETNVYKDETNNALLHETPRKNYNRLFAFSLEPCTDVRTTVLSQLNRNTGRRNNTTVHVCTSHPLFLSQQCGALVPTAVEDYLISEHQDAHGEKSRRLATSVQNSFLVNNTVNSCCHRMLKTEGRVWSPYKNCAPQIRCKGKPRQHKDVKESVTSCSLPLCRRNTKLFSHTCMTCTQIDFVSLWTLYDIVCRRTRLSAQRQLMPYHTSFSNSVAHDNVCRLATEEGNYLSERVQSVTEAACGSTKATVA